jgi:hypothetical protein
MGFLAALLPGAREARNHLFVGAAWLALVLLLAGSPEADSGTSLDKALDSFGATGTLLIAAAAATVIGALVDELCELLIEGPVRKHVSPGRIVMGDFRPSDDESLMGQESLVGRDISDFEQRELEREDARSDRAFSEVKLRLGLAPALMGLALVLPADTNVSMGMALGIGAIGLLFGASGVRRVPDYINRSAQARATRRELQSRGVRRPGGEEGDRTSPPGERPPGERPPGGPTFPSEQTFPSQETFPGGSA